MGLTRLLHRLGFAGDHGIRFRQPLDTFGIAQHFQERLFFRHAQRLIQLIVQRCQRGVVDLARRAFEHIDHGITLRQVNADVGWQRTGRRPEHGIDKAFTIPLRVDAAKGDGFAEAFCRRITSRRRRAISRRRFCRAGGFALLQ